MRRSALSALLLIPVWTGIAPAIPLITFNTPISQKVSTGGGEISYAGGSSSLVGTNIIISDIVAGSTTVGCVTCMLNFTTGAFQSLTDIAGVRTWVFAPGSQTLGQFTVTGTVPTLGITSPTTLLSGFFTAPTLELTGPTGVTPRYRFFSGSLFDVKNPGLVDALLGAGFSSTYGNYFTGNYTQEFVDNLTRPSQIPILSDTLLAGSITNDTVQPEPAQVILFSSLSLVLAIGIVVRRRKSKLAAN